MKILDVKASGRMGNQAMLSMLREVCSDGDTLHPSVVFLDARNLKVFRVDDVGQVLKLLGLGWEDPPLGCIEAREDGSIVETRVLKAPQKAR